MMLKLETLPKGFRFRPTDEELIDHYLRLKINGHHSSAQVIPEVDVCKREPWDLPALSVIKSDDPEWFFFCLRDRKYPKGHRSNRATEIGYWKATGKDRTIKSRKPLPSGRSNTKLIGMKKTLVFYKGRAPKGERTNWIMHEYRATEPDLDGSGPGQADYVLCRLFHKVDDKLDNANYDEVEPTGSSPSTGKSSPDDATSDLLQEPSVVGMEIKEMENVKKEWTCEVDHLTSMMQVPVDRCEVNVSGSSGDITAREVYDPLSEIPKFKEPTDKFLNSFQSHNYDDSGACIGSPFSYDFGYDPNGLHFQDGASEQDASLSELLKDLHNLDNYFYMESTACMNFGATKDSLMPGQINGLEQAPSAFSEANHLQIHDESGTQMAESQYPSVQGHPSTPFLQVEPSSDRSFSQYAFKDDSFANRVMSSHYEGDKSFSDSCMIKDSSTVGIGPAIRIRSRPQRNQPSSVNTATQGIASRRIHLSMKRRSNSIGCGISEDVNNTKEKESWPLVTEANENIDRTCKSHDPDHGHRVKTKEIAQACDQSLKPPGKDGDEKGSVKMTFIPLSAFSFRKGASNLNVYVLSIYLVIITSALSLGLWKCPILGAL